MVNRLFWDCLIGQLTTLCRHFLRCNEWQEWGESGTKNILFFLDAAIKNVLKFNLLFDLSKVNSLSTCLPLKRFVQCIPKFFIDINIMNHQFLGEMLAVVRIRRRCGINF